MRKTRERKLLIFFFLLPAVVLYVAFTVIPGVNAFRYSLTKWDGLTQPLWVGLQNFRSLFAQHTVFLHALKNNVFLMVVPSVIMLALALFFASLMRSEIRGAKLFRITFYFPNVISGVAISVLWMLIYSSSGHGVLNAILEFFGHSRVDFVASDRLIVSIVPMIVWSGVGFFMLLFLAAMQNIPETLYEAARIDGAGQWASFRHVTFPMIWGVFTTALVFLVMAGLKIFDQIWVMEYQHPVRASHVISTLMYQKIFQEYRIGYGTAIAVFQFVLVLAATLLTLRLTRRERVEY